MIMKFNDADLAHIVATIWESVLGITCVHTSDDPGCSQHTVSACVQITGAWKGAVLLSCPLPFARRAASLMFDTAAGECSLHDMQDAVAELTNMIGGNLKGTLPEAETCQLSLPSVVAGADYTARVPGSQLLNRVAMDCGGQVVLASVLEKSPAEKAA